MVFWYINRPRGGGARAYDADVLAWESAAVANGGNPDLDYRRYLDDFVYAEKSSGSWALTDDYWVLWAPDAGCALTSLKQRRLATAVNSPTFTADRGYAFDGATQYINTGFIPSTHKVAMTGTNLRIAVYERTNVAANTNAAGCFNSSTQSLTMSPRLTGGQLSTQLNSQTSGPGGDVLTDSRGYSAGSRNGDATTIKAYKNGAEVVPYTPGSVGSTLPTVPVFIGAACNNSSAATGFRAASEGFVAVGAALSGAQELAQYNAIQAFATAVGAQV